MNFIKKSALSVISALLVSCFVSDFKADSKEELPKGWLLWHSYSGYSDMDSKLFLQSPNNTIREIKGNFIHAMNGSFGNTPADIVFMAIDEKADEWDVFLYNAIDECITNLTEKSGFRNEDPKFSPDGQKIVFKRGVWNHQKNDFTYNLAEIDIETGNINYITCGENEKAMPFYSADGKSVYYTEYDSNGSSIQMVNLSDGSTEEVYHAENTVSYYPVVYNDVLYFTRSFSLENQNDSIIRIQNGKTEVTSFSSEFYNCSDPCPVDYESVIYSCTQNGNYDLFFFNGSESTAIDNCNTEKHELGSSFYSFEKFENYIKNMNDFILGQDSVISDYDFNNDGTSDCFDMVLARQHYNSEIYCE